MGFSGDCLQNESFLREGFAYLPNFLISEVGQLKSHKTSATLDLVNPNKIHSFQMTGATDWNITSHCGPSPLSSVVRSIICSPKVHQMCEAVLLDKAYWIKCTRLYRQNLGFYMHWHHDSKSESNITNGLPGLVWLVCLDDQPLIPFQVIPRSHLLTPSFQKSSFSEREISLLYSQKILTQAPRSIFFNPGDALIFDSRLLHRDSPTIRSQLGFCRSFPRLSRQLFFMQFTTDSSNVENLFVDGYSLYLTKNIWWPQDLKSYYPQFPYTSIATVRLVQLLSLLLIFLLMLPGSILRAFRRYGNILGMIR